LLITLWRFQFVIGQFIPKGKRSYPGSQNSENAVADDPVLKFLYDADFTSCRILSAMSPEIQEWSHKSRSRINNLYLLTRPIFKCRHRSCGYVTLLYRTGNVGYHIGYYTHTNVFTLQGLHSWKVAILECIQIPQLGLVNWRCYKFYTALYSRCDGNKMCVVFLLIGWLAFALALTGGSL